MDDPLSNDHAELGELLAKVRDALEAGDVTQTHSCLDLFWARLAMHIRAEHLHLFPAILRGLKETRTDNARTMPPQPEALSTIEQLRSDHDFFMHELGRAMATMRALVASGAQSSIGRDLEEVKARIIAVAERLATHNKLEESHVYRWTDAILTSDEQHELEMLIHRELGNLPARLVEKEA